MAHQVNFAEWQEKLRDERSIVIDLGDDSITVPPPILWPDALDGETVEGLYHRIVGDEQWEQWTAAGGTAAMLDKIISDHMGAPAGE